MSHTYHFDVKMSCSGCSNSVKKALERLDGVKSTDISLDSQTVDVTTEPSVSYDTVYNTIAKTGKTINSGSTVAWSISKLHVFASYLYLFIIYLRLIYDFVYVYVSWFLIM